MRGGGAHIYKGRQVANQWVAPYNPYLSLKYDAHVNVEVCGSVKSVKYLFKYVYKGHDRSMAQIAPGDGPQAGAPPAPRDEISELKDFRPIGASEACWRTFGCAMSDRSPAVTALSVHLDGQ